MSIIILMCLILANNVSPILSANPLLLATGHSENTVVKNRAECILKFFVKYFIEKISLRGSIVIINLNSYKSRTQRILFQTIHGAIKYSIMVKDSFYVHANASHFPEKAKNYMLMLEEKSELMRNILQLSKLPTWNPLAKAIVHYKLKTNEDGENTAINFINELREYKLLKTIILIYSSENQEVVSYTWSPYSTTNCGGKCESVYILDKCKDRILKQVELQKEMFPLDMKWCPLIATAVVAEPYVMPPKRKLYNSTFDDAYEFHRGSDVNLVEIISQFKNMKLIIRMSATPENWGSITTNGTATGAYAMLRNDLTDVVIGNIEVTRILRQWFSPTASYTQDEMTWCVPKAVTASTWNNLVIIFQWSTWAATFVSLITMGFVFHYFYYRENARKATQWPTTSLLMTFSMLLGSVALFRPRSSTFRILIFGWLCFSVNLIVSYQAFLQTFLMYPRFEKQISSEADLIRTKIPLGGREIYRSYFDMNNASSSYLYRKYQPTSFAKGIRRVALERNFAIVSSRRQAQYQDQALDKGVPLIFCFPESNNLYMYSVVLLARKWFPMLEQFNTIIRRVSENGLIDKWNKESFILTVGLDGKGTTGSLGVQHLSGAFMFIGIMYGVSVFVFVCELTLSYFIQRRNKRLSIQCKRMIVYRN